MGGFGRERQERVRDDEEERGGPREVGDRWLYWTVICQKQHTKTLTDWQLEENGGGRKMRRSYGRNRCGSGEFSSTCEEVRWWRRVYNESQIPNQPFQKEKKEGGKKEQGNQCSQKQLSNNLDEAQ